MLASPQGGNRGQSNSAPKPLRGTPVCLFDSEQVSKQDRGVQVKVVSKDFECSAIRGLFIDVY